MSKSNFANKLTRTFNKGALQIKKHSPEILLVTGVVGVVGSAILACRATTKASAIIEKHKEKVKAIHEVAENPQYADEYTPQDCKKDLTIVHAQTGLQFAKLYGPAVLLGAASIGCIFASHNIIRKRNLALSAAYATANATLKDYKKRVVDRLGEEMERELTYNIKAKEVEEVVSNEDGTQTTVTKTVNVSDGPVLSRYAICFDETCLNWSRNAEENKAFLLQVQAMLNDRLRRKHVVFLNELHDAIGLPRTAAGQVVGWVYESEDGDGYIDLGIHNIYRAENRAFVNGLEKSVWLDPNVDGEVYQLLK